MTSHLLGGPGRTAALALRKRLQASRRRKRLAPSGRIDYVPWGKALTYVQVEPEPPAPSPPKAPWQNRPKRRRRRYLRPGRVKYSQRYLNTATVPLRCDVYIPVLLDDRLRRLATIDDRTLGELIVLGLVWVVTEWAAKRQVPAEWLPLVEAYRLRHHRRTRPLKDSRARSA